MPAPIRIRRHDGKGNVTERRYTKRGARARAGDFRRSAPGSARGRRAGLPGKPGQYVRAGRAATPNPGGGVPNPTTPGRSRPTAAPASTKRGPLKKAKSAVKNFRATRAAKKAQKARQKANRLRARG